MVINLIYVVMMIRTRASQFEEYYSSAEESKSGRRIGQRGKTRGGHKSLNGFVEELFIIMMFMMMFIMMFMMVMMMVMRARPHGRQGERSGCVTCTRDIFGDDDDQ